MNTTENKVVISEELLDHIVNALTKLPYRDVQEIFLRLGHEMQQDSEQTPRIIA